jgi:AmmeMemoRadiSam system protein B
MSESKLFNSITDPIPLVRRDIQIIPVQQNGNTYLYFHDDKGYATPQFALRKEAANLLSLIDGRKSIRDLKSFIGDDVPSDQLLQFVRLLDENRILASNYLRNYSEKIEQDYEQSQVHEFTTAGSSYPAEPAELKKYLDDAFADRKVSNSPGHGQGAAKALYAPHIDPRVGLDSYVKAFSSIRHLTPKRVVILATSHYAGLYPDIYQESPFILVNKNYETPLGTILRDEKIIKKLYEAGDKAGITQRDRAHRTEHSIELHLLFLRYIWDHDFEIVPFLTRGLDDLYYMQDGNLGKQLSHFSSLLNSHFGDCDDTFFLISGDLAHFGKKFGDETAASGMFEEVEKFDRNFLKHASNNHPDKLLELMKKEIDPYRICGFSPLYTFLRGMTELQGEILSYDLWDECERDSAVSYGSILYRHQ